MCIYSALCYVLFLLAVACYIFRTVKKEYVTIPQRYRFSGDPLSIRGSVLSLSKQFTQPVQLHSLCWARDFPHLASADCIGLNFSPRSAYFVNTVISLDATQDYNIKTSRGKSMLSVLKQNEHRFKGRMLFGIVI